MGRSAMGRLVPLGAGALAVIITACSSGSSTSPSGAVNLAGTYNLTALTYNGTHAPIDANDGATLVLTTSTYAITAFGLDSVLTDSGSYTATSSGAYTQESAEGHGVATGTYTQSANKDTLSVNATANNLPLLATWVRAGA